MITIDLKADDLEAAPTRLTVRSTTRENTYGWLKQMTRMREWLGPQRSCWRCSMPEFGQNLPALRSAAIARVNAMAGDACRQFTTDIPGQEMIYRE